MSASGTYPAAVESVSSEERPHPSRHARDRLYLAVLLAIHLLSWAPRLIGPLDLRWDGAVYYTLGTSLAERKGYRLLYEPGQIEALQYPPLLPAIIAAHERILGTADPVKVGQALRITWFVFATALVYALYWLARKYLAPGFAFCAAMAWILNANGLFLSNLCFAELPFTLSTVLFFRWLKGGGRLTGSLAGASAIGSYLLRSVGSVTLLVWILDSALCRRRREAFLRSAVAGAVILGWLGWGFYVKHSPEYKQTAYAYQRAPYLFYNVSYTENLSYFDTYQPELGGIGPADMIYRGLGGALRMPYVAGQALIDQIPSWMAVFKLSRPLVSSLKVGATLWGIAALFGIGVLFARGEFLLPVYLCLSFVAIAILPWPEQAWRYMTPLVPFILISLFCLMQATKEAGKVLKGTWRLVAGLTWRLGVIAFFSMVITEFLGTVQVLESRASTSFLGERTSFSALHYDVGWNALDRAMEWIRRDARPSDVIVSSTPAWIYWHTGHQSVMPPFEGNAIVRQRLLRSTGAQYVILETMGGATLTTNYLAKLTAGPDWTIVFGAPGSPVSVYKYRSRQ